MRSVMLVTRCGCDRVVPFPEPLPPEIRCALLPPPIFKTASISDTPDPGGFAVRVFRSHGMARGLPRYLEHTDVLVKLPEAPRMTRDEWADAVARFMGIQNAAFGEDWAKVQEDFYRRHDGATMVVHASSKLLVGAFYPAPQWQHAEEAIAVFRAIARIEEP